jgi:hypothetical protein
MNKINNQVDQTMNINPEFFCLFAQELDRIEQKENKKNDVEKKNNTNTNTNTNTNNNTNNNSNTNDNIVIYISKKETKIIKKLLTLVDNIMKN